MRVQLRIKLTAGVVMVNGKRQVASRPVLIGAGLANTGGCIVLGFLQSFRNGSAMCLNQPIIGSHDCKHRDRFWEPRS